MPDLIIAAVGARERLPIVHYDADYDRIAAITGQATRWVIPREDGGPGNAPSAD